MKFYAVKKGFNPGIYKDWDSCSRNVTGFKGAIYKSFNTIEEAEAYLNDEVITKEETFDIPTAYVDGSYNVSTQEYSFGAILFVDGKKLKFSKKFSGDDDCAQFRNVAGEVKGAAFIINYCIKHNIKELNLYYDYKGIEEWYLFNWKANTSLTMKYQEFAKESKDKITVNFHKVKSHTGIKYNEEVDLLAKEALEI